MRKILLALVTVLLVVLALWLLALAARLIWDAPYWIELSPEWLGRLVEWLYLFTVGMAVFLVVWNQGRPSRTLAWVVVLVFLPAVGILAYLLLGGNPRKEKLFSQKGAQDLQQFDEWFSGFRARFHDQSWSEQPAVLAKAQLVQLLMQSSKAFLSMNNRVEPLQNGRATFQAMFQAIRQARHHIHLEFYIIEDGILLEELVTLLASKCSEGVAVRLIYDSVGCWALKQKTLNRMQAAGIETGPFHPVRFPRLGNRINYRNHRKIVVIDGTVGFVGGLNLADRYLDGLEGVGPWRDLHLRVEGEAVKGLQLIFLTDWYFVNGTDCASPDLFPELPLAGSAPVQVVASGADSRHAGILQGFVWMLYGAKDYCYIASPYLIPVESALQALRSAALSGVDVRILLPRRSDSRLAAFSMMSYLDELLEAGVRIYLYQPGFLHAKLMLSDDLLCSVGSANWDQRSFDQNFEANAFVYDRETTLALKAQFMADLEASQELTLEAWHAYPAWQRMLWALARLVSPLL